MSDEGVGGHASCFRDLGKLLSLAWSLRSAQRSLRLHQMPRPGAIGTVVPVSWVDAKLAYRMLRKYPVLTVVSVLSISGAVGAAAGFFAFSQNLLEPTLPLEGPDRLVGIQNWDVASDRPSYRSLHDFGAWRAQLKSIHELGAFERFQPNLVLPDGRSEPVLASRITAEGFGAAHVAPILGRPLIGADETAAPDGDVMVIGFDVWQRVFRGDPTVLGRVVRLGARSYTIVGVMPQGFRFPLNDDLWVPLHDDPAATGPIEGPFVFVVGRLSDGASIEQAQTEVEWVSHRIAAQHPTAYASLRPRVQPFAQSMNGGSTARFRAGRLILLLLLIVVCANVGALIYARNASRVSEVTIRQALGASRPRIKGNEVRLVNASALQEHEDPIVTSFLDLLASDMEAHPDRLRPFSTEMVARAKELTKGVEIDHEAHIEGRPDPFSREVGTG